MRPYISQNQSVFVQQRDQLPADSVAALKAFLALCEVLTLAALAVLLLDRFPLILALLPEEFGSVRSFFQ